MLNLCTPCQIISKTDMEFKVLTPIEDSITVFQAVGEKPEFFSVYKMYEKALMVKPGDKFRMNMSILPLIKVM